MTTLVDLIDRHRINFLNVDGTFRARCLCKKWVSPVDDRSVTRQHHEWSKHLAAVIEEALV